MPQARLIVCERKGEWAVALRQADPSLQRAMRETRSLRESRSVLEESPASLVAIELATNAVEDVVQFVVGVSRDFPHARSIVMAPRSHELEVAAAREAGAIHAAVGKLELATTTTLIRRHLARYPSEPSIIEEIKERLPWPDSASGE